MSRKSDSLNIYDLKDLQLEAIWILDHFSDSKDRLSSLEIANYLTENYKISTSRQAVRYALEKETGVVHKNKDGYKLMEVGLKKLITPSSKNSNNLFLIEPGKPFSAKNIVLKNIFDNLKSPILISDPYLDIDTLNVLFKNIDQKKQVKFLTHNLIDKPSGILSRHLKEIRQEGFQIEVGIYSNSELHDRYIMDNNLFWLSGNSLNHLGDKESFLVSLGEDVRQSMLATFNNRWKISQKI
jgi:hypothetical protein